MHPDYSYKRRAFIKNITAAGAAAVVAPSIAYAAYGHTETVNDNGQNTTFLFQGDSITDGNRSRNNDWNHVMGHGYAYLVACRLGFDQPDKTFHFFNRGVSGNKITDLEKRWQTDTLDIKPGVLSMLVGVNDVNSVIAQQDVVDAARYEEVYRALLTQTKAQLPGIQLVMCEPFLLPVGKVKDNWEPWETDMKKRQQVVQRLAAEFKAVYVPLQEAFTEACQKAPADYWIWDGIHPMPAGHELIARHWLKAVKKQLGFIKITTP